jgi:hypothetical protein
MQIEFPEVISKDLEENDLIFEDPMDYHDLDNYGSPFSMELYSSCSWKYNKDRTLYAIYFKVYISHRIRTYRADFVGCKSTKMYRVSILSPEYVVAKDNGEKGYMSKEEVAKMISVLKKQHFDYDYNNWQFGLHWLNNNHSWDGTVDGDTDIPWKELPRDLPIPDYTKLPTRD